MCLSESGHSKYKLKCTVIAVVSLIVNATLSCLSITALTLAIKKNFDGNFLLVNQNPFMWFGNTDKSTFVGLSSTALALGLLGLLASILLMIGSKYNKPGCVAVYVCYGLQTSILLLIIGIFLFMKLHWSFAIPAFCLSGLACEVTIIVNKSYEAMLEEELLRCQDNISDLTLLIQADSSDDPTSIPAV